MNETEEIVAVIHLPLSVNGFVGLLNGLQNDTPSELYIRNSPEGYEVFRLMPKVEKPPQLPDGGVPGAPGVRGEGKRND